LVGGSNPPECVNEYNLKVRLKKGKIILIKEDGKRNKVISLVSGENVHSELLYERRETEKEIKEIQHRFYNEKKIPESVYKMQFNILSERLAEIEEEKLSLEMLEVKKASKKERFPKIKEKIRNREKRKEEERRKKVEELLRKNSPEKK
jgi:hypothetical protein